MWLSFDSYFSVAKLLNNYRSHAAIIRYPSEKFYAGELVPCGERTSINSCLDLELLGRSKYPVIFNAMEGHDMREASSPSFFNPEEVLQVKAYVQQLLADTRAVPRIGKFYLSLKIHFSIFPEEPAHIGIIAPYRAQCTKLRKTLKQIAPEIKIGSVEEYQGDVSGFFLIDFFTWLTRFGIMMDSQERRVIIITTVRSSRDYINYDLRYTLGFVANPRRFNGTLRYTLLSQKGYSMSHTHICVRSCFCLILQSRSLVPKHFLS